GRRSNRGAHAHLGLAWLAQHIPAAPHGLDVVFAIRGLRKLLTDLAHEDVNDLELRLVPAAIEMVEKHLLGARGALAHAQELQHLVFLPGKRHGSAAHLDRLCIEIDAELASVDDGLRRCLGPADNRLNARHELVLVKWLGHVVVGPEAETSYLVRYLSK